MKHYIYTLIDPRNNLPFYVGKGKDGRMYAHETETRSGCFYNKEKCKIIQEIWDAKLDIKYEQMFVENDMVACKEEKRLIAKYGRRFNKTGILTNIHVGGGGKGKTGIAVYQYTKSGIFITKYKSAALAEKQTNISAKSISAVCRGEYNTTAGFQWKRENDLPIKNYTRQSGHNLRKISQYDLNGKIVQEHKNGYAAAKNLNLPKNGANVITQCCRTAKPSYNGFQWRYSGDVVPQKLKLRKKAILQYTQDGMLLAEFVSIAEAIRITKIGAISACCNGKYKQAGGYVWKFKN